MSTTTSSGNPETVRGGDGFSSEVKKMEMAKTQQTKLTTGSPFFFGDMIKKEEETSKEEIVV